MITSLILFENEFLNIVFTALALDELIRVASKITTWYGTLNVRLGRVRLPGWTLKYVYMVISETVTGRH